MKKLNFFSDKDAIKKNLYVIKILNLIKQK